MPYDCFVSYASADLGHAENLQRRLKEEGFTVWFDRARLEPGVDWHREIEQGCENSRILLPVLTPRWKQSDWTKFETYGAEAVVPLVVEGGWAEVSTPPLERFQAESLRWAPGEANDWSRLFASLRGILARPVPEKAERLVHLQHRANDFFVGREPELIRIHEELHANPRAVLTRGRVRAIAAMGGAGKTTLVRHYAEKFWRCYPQMFWVDCRLGFETEFAHIHDLLFPASSASGYSDSDKAARAMQELQREGTRLLILDNAPDDERLVAPWLPKTGGCHTLITSRFAAWSAAIKTIHLRILDKEPSLEFLQGRAGREAAGPELAACGTLAEELGYLPLAMEQAAAYIEQQGGEFGFSDYLRIYGRARKELLEIGALGSTDYPHSVMTTWKSAMAKLTPAARAVLSCGAFLASTPLPVEVLIASAGRVRRHADRGTPHVEGPSPDPEFYLRAALNDLKRYSVADFDGRSLSVHPLVQLVVRESLAPADRIDCWKTAVALLVGCAGDHGMLTQLRERWKPLLSHAEALHATWGALRGVPPSTELAELLRDCYFSLGRYEEALPYARQVHEEDVQQFGETSREAERSLSSLGVIHQRRKDYPAAATAHGRARQMAAERYGELHPATLAHTHDLAHSLEKMGRIEEAASHYQSILKVNPSDVVTMGDYAYMLQNVIGDLEQARALYRRALGLYPGDIINLNNYAGLCLVLGDFPAAEASLRDAWKIASVRKDRFAARSLLLRAALACFRAESPHLFYGQLKAIFEAGISPAPSENVSVMRHIREHLGAEDAALLEAIFAAINDRPALDNLKGLARWSALEPIALEESWPA